MRNLRVASISFREGGNPERSLPPLLSLVDRAAQANPDIIVLPEACANMTGTAQPVPGPISDAMAERAQRIGCYMIVPMIKREPDGTLYNVALLLDPTGQVVGEYRKMFPTDYEMADGIVPGEHATTFDTPFGRIGVAICFDLNFSEVIEGLAANGAEVVFFVSAYEGGRQLQHWALEHGVYVVSAFWRGIGYFVDKSGQVLQKGERTFQPIVVRDLNLDRKILHLDYNGKKLPDIVSKYGKSVHIDVYGPEDFFALESRSPDVNVKDIMKEFGLESYSEYLARSRQLRQARLRGEQVRPGPA